MRTSRNRLRLPTASRLARYFITTTGLSAARTSGRSSSRCRRAPDRLLVRLDGRQPGHRQQEPRAVRVPRVERSPEEEPPPPRAAQEVRQVVAAEIALLRRDEDRRGQDLREHLAGDRVATRPRSGSAAAPGRPGGSLGADGGDPVVPENRGGAEGGGSVADGTTVPGPTPPRPVRRDRCGVPVAHGPTWPTAAVTTGPCRSASPESGVDPLETPRARPPRRARVPPRCPEPAVCPDSSPGARGSGSPAWTRARGS